MNTKTSYKHAHNFYDGSNHAATGGDGPGALLDMLAEVASRTLRSERVRADPPAGKREKGDGGAEADTDREVCRNLPRILSMPLTQLVKNFAVLESDDLGKRYSYACALVPGCQQIYTSFASESRARMSITMHLANHVDRLRNNQDSCRREGKDTAARPRPDNVAIEGKKQKCQRGKKPQKIPNKENKRAKSEKSTCYPRKIASNEIRFKEFEIETKLDDRNRVRERCPMEVKNDRDTEFKVLGDHSYYEHIEDYTPREDAAMSEATSKNTMAVERERVFAKKVALGTDEDANIGEEIAVPVKPKGKAKFIGTSKEEREMALILMERIKKKGNPTGNNLQCRICDPPRTFTAPTTLVSHYRSHAGIKPYECRICHSVFTRRHSLKYHMLIHQNQTRFTCADCGKKFRHPSHFREHRRRHTGESPFGCDDCGQRFKTRNTYKRHLKTRHGKVLTTTGELLCLTEEEFEKVQTNRKRKSRSVSLEFLPDQDSARTGVEPASVDDALDNNNETEETVIKTDKTEELETADPVEDNVWFDNGAYEESTDRILYDGIVGSKDEEPVDESIDSSIEILDNPINSIKSEGVEYDQSSTSLVVEEFVVPYDGEEEYYETGSIANEEMIRYSEHRSLVIEKSLTSNDRNNDSEDNLILPDETERKSGTADLRIDQSLVNGRTFLILTNDDLKGSYLRIDSDNIVVPQS